MADKEYMSDINIMNLEMLEIVKTYLELCVVFNDKLEEIHADEVLNTNLELLKASITDLNINITNFKSTLDSSSSNAILDTSRNSYPNTNINAKNSTNTNTNVKNIAALFFLYLMQVDKDSITNTNNSENTKPKKIYEDPEPD